MHGVDAMPDENHVLLELITSEIPWLLCYARVLCRDRDRAEDLVQTCLMRALERLDSFTPGTRLRPWLRAILRNLFIDNWRAARRHSDVWAAGEEDAARQPAAASNQEAAIVLKDLRQALGALPDEQRELILLVTIEGASYEEAAALQGVPVGTIRSRLCRARKSLLRLIEGDAGRR